MRACQLRTLDRESADDRLTSATEKTTPTLSDRVPSSLPMTGYNVCNGEDNARVRLKYVNVHCLRVFSFVKKCVLLP